MCRRGRARNGRSSLLLILFREGFALRVAAKEDMDVRSGGLECDNSAGAVEPRPSVRSRLGNTSYVANMLRLGLSWPNKFDRTKVEELEVIKSASLLFAFALDFVDAGPETASKGKLSVQ